MAPIAGSFELSGFSSSATGAVLVPSATAIPGPATIVLIQAALVANALWRRKEH